MPATTQALAGKTGWFKIAGVGYPFKSWTLRLSCTKIDITNFLSGGFSEWIAGFASGTVQAAGVLVQGLQLAIGSFLENVSLGCGGGLATTFSGVVLDLSVTTAVDKAAEVNLELGTNGVFSPTFAAA